MKNREIFGVIVVVDSFAIGGLWLSNLFCSSATLLASFDWKHGNEHIHETESINNNAVQDLLVWDGDIPVASNGGWQAR
jgi:hypothetical protein